LYNPLAPQTSSVEPEHKFQAPTRAMQNCLGSVSDPTALFLSNISKFALHGLDCLH